MARTNTLANFLTDVANAIRAKKGTESTITAANFDTEIQGIVIPTIEATKNVAPGTTIQTVTPTQGYDGMAEVTVSPVTAAIDGNIVAGNIKKDVAVLGVTGTYDGGVTSALSRAY